MKIAEKYFKNRFRHNECSTKREVITIFKNTINNFRFNFKAVVYFEICYRLLTSFIFVPINYFIVDRFIKLEGRYSLSNAEFLNFALTFRGIICILLLILVAFSVIFIEISVLTYIGYKSHKKEKVTLIEGVFNSFGVLPRVIRSGMFSLFFITAFVGPLIGIGLSSSLIKELTVPPFITAELAKTNMGKIYYAIFITVLVLLLLRAVLAIPEIIIENKRGRQCFKDSKRLYKRNKLTMFIYMGMWLIFSSTITHVIMSAFATLEVVVANLLGSESFEFLILGGIIFVLFYIIYIIISLIIMPAFISFLVEIFYKLKNYKVEERDFSTHEDYKKNKIYLTAKRYSKIYVNASICMFIVFMGYRCFNVVFDKVIDKEVQVTSHRGGGFEAPENSISAIRKAIENKVDYAEIDVQTTKDDVVVLFHDTNLKRFSKESGAIKDFTYDELSKIDIGSSFSSDYEGERIPTLESVLREAKGRVKLNIELKPMKNNDCLALKVVDIVRKYNMENEVVITSMNYDILQKVKKMDPSIKVGYIIIAAIGNVQNMQVDFLSVESSIIKSKLIYSMHTLGKEVHAWTVNDEKEAAQMIKLGVDNIITDNVKLIEDAKDLSKWEEKDHLRMYLESITYVTKYGKI